MLCNTHEVPRLLKIGNTNPFVEVTQFVSFPCLPSLFVLLVSAGHVALSGIEESPEAYVSTGHYEETPLCGTRTEA